ncbi:MAG: DNA topoisomerase IB [Flavobacteriales bacterium]
MVKRSTRENLALHTAPPALSASAAQLRYVRHFTIGIERIGKRNFRYRLEGKRIRNRETLKRIAQLAIPPAWTNVWICPYANGHLQATGVDAKGRKQYRYHNDWSTVRSETKFAHIQEFGKQLVGMRKRITAHLRLPGLPKEKVMAAVVSIMDRTQIRVGHYAYAKENGTFGLSTLLDKHVKTDGAGVRFEFKGKTGVRHSIRLGSSHLSKLVQRCKDLPGQDLFQYVDEHGEARPIDSGMVNDYIRSITAGRFTSKDIRTWKGTVHCMRALQGAPPAPTQTKQRQQINEALDAVARQLGNTRSVCRKYYVHPQVIEAYSANALVGLNGRGRASRSLSPEERSVLRLLARPPARAAKGEGILVLKAA